MYRQLSTLLAFLSVVLAYGQTLTIQGTVLDGASKTPLQWVKIVEQGSKQGVVSDELGKFTINLDFTQQAS